MYNYLILTGHRRVALFGIAYGGVDPVRRKYLWSEIDGKIVERVHENRSVE